MLLLPVARGGKQKFVLGDDSGALQCYKIRKGECAEVFKTESGKSPISCVAHAGMKDKKDKIFYSEGTVIEGISKSGRNFFKFNTNLTEPVLGMFVENRRIYTAGEYIYNMFEDAADKHFYLCSDKVNDITVEVVAHADYDVVLACQDRNIRFIRESAINMEVSIKGPAQCVHRYAVDNYTGKRCTKKTKLIYGTENGLVGQLVVDNGGAKIRRDWTIENEARQGPINCVDDHDVTKDDVSDLLVSRNDGIVQIYGFDMGPTPTLQYEASIQESCQSLCAGVVASQGFDEILICTFSGRVLSFTTEPLFEQQHETDTAGRSKGKMESLERTQKIRQQLEALQKKVLVQKDKLSKFTNDFIPMEQQFTVKHKFHLDSEEAVYKITVEAPLPLELVMLQSTKPIRLVDTESNQAIVSLSKPADGNMLLATYRCQEPTNRLEMKLRTVEGQYGDLQVIVVAQMQPSTAQTVTLKIKPLSLHHRVNNLIDSRALNTITFAGKFTGRQMHEWISECLPEVPNRGDDEKGEVELFFRNSFLTSLLLCKYGNKQAVFKSDSISTIAILKEVITKLATARKISVRTDFKINPDTIPEFLKLVHPKLEYQLQLKQKADLIEALKEIKMQEDDTSFLDPDYAKIIKDREKIVKEFKDRPKALKSLYGIVTDLYVDMHKFQGIDIARNRDRILPLMNLLEHYTFESVLNFFVKKPVDHAAAAARP